MLDTSTCTLYMFLNNLGYFFSIPICNIPILSVNRVYISCIIYHIAVNIRKIENNKRTKHAYSLYLA